VLYDILRLWHNVKLVRDKFRKWQLRFIKEIPPAEEICPESNRKFFRKKNRKNLCFLEKKAKRADPGGK